MSNQRDKPKEGLILAPKLPGKGVTVDKKDQGIHVENGKGNPFCFDAKSSDHHNKQSDGHTINDLTARGHRTGDPIRGHKKGPQYQPTRKNMENGVLSPQDRNDCYSP